MKVKELIYLIFILAASAILSIGRFYDERLDFFEIKFSLILSLTYFFSTFVLISSIRKTSIEKSKILLYSLYVYIIVVTPILWVLFENIEFTFPSFSYDHMQYFFSSCFIFSFIRCFWFIFKFFRKIKCFRRWTYSIFKMDVFSYFNFNFLS